MANTEIAAPDSDPDSGSDAGPDADPCANPEADRAALAALLYGPDPEERSDARRPDPAREPAEYHSEDLTGRAGADAEPTAPFGKDWPDMSDLFGRTNQTDLDDVFSVVFEMGEERDPDAFDDSLFFAHPSDGVADGVADGMVGPAPMSAQPMTQPMTPRVVRFADMWQRRRRERAASLHKAPETHDADALLDRVLANSNAAPVAGEAVAGETVAEATVAAATLDDLLADDLLADGPLADGPLADGPLADGPAGAPPAVAEGPAISSAQLDLAFVLAFADEEEGQSGTAEDGNATDRDSKDAADGDTAASSRAGSPLAAASSSDPLAALLEPEMVGPDLLDAVLLELVLAAPVTPPTDRVRPTAAFDTTTDADAADAGQDHRTGDLGNDAGSGQAWADDAWGDDAWGDDAGGDDGWTEATGPDEDLTEGNPAREGRAEESGTGLDRTGLDRTGPDWTDPDWTDPDWTGPDRTGPDWNDADRADDWDMADALSAASDDEPGDGLFGDAPGRADDVAPRPGLDAASGAAVATPAPTLEPARAGRQGESRQPAAGSPIGRATGASGSSLRAMQDLVGNDLLAEVLRDNDDRPASPPAIHPSTTPASFPDAAPSPAVQPRYAPARRSGMDDLDRVLQARAVRSSPRRKWLVRLIWLILLGALAYVAFLPYRFEVGGEFVIQPSDRAEVRARTGGEITALHVSEGDWVEAGTVLAVLSNWNQRRDVALIRHEGARLEAQLATLVAGSRPEEITVAEQNLTSAEVQLTLRQQELDRQEVLFASGTIPQKAVQDARSAQQLALSARDQAAAALALVKAGPLQTEIDALEASIAGNAEQLAFAELMLDYTFIRSPVAGQIVSPITDVPVGYSMTVGGLFAEIENNRTLIAQLSVPEITIDEVEVGAPVQLRLWSDPGDTIAGTVRSIAPRAEEEDFGQIVRVQVEVPNPDGRLAANLTGYGKINAEERPVWQAFSRAIERFFVIEVWSWLP